MANKINFQVGFSVDKSGLSEMQSLFQQIAFSAQEPGNKLNTELQQAAKTASTLDGILSKTFNTELGTLNVTKFNQELKNSGLTLKTIQSDFSKIGTQGADAYNRLAQAVLGTNQQLKQSSKLLNEMFTTLKNTVRYGISSSIFNNMTNSIQKAYDYSKQLDTSLNDIRIVTDKSAESMADFAKQANEAAKGLGASTLDYTNASLIYYQQGLSDAEVAARAETTIKAANVTGQTGEEVSEQLTAVWNGYKVTAEETELYVDKLAAVAATTAADLEELSVGMSKVASAANAMGVDFDDLNAQIATIVSVTRQAPESVGTALKTIYARLGDLKVDGVDEFGVSLGEVSSQMVQMGIQILDQEGNLRDMSSVIAEVAEKWTGWTEAQRQAAAVAMAGKRQYNNLIALFDNWDMYTEALNTSTEAVGTLQHQQDIYMESTAAKLKTLKAAWQGLYDDAIDTDEINAGIEALTNLVEVFDNFIDSFGGGIKSIAGFGTIISSVFNKQIADSINAANQRVQVFKNNLELAKTTNDFRMQGAMEAGDTARSQAIAANTQKQIDLSQQIYNIRAGLSQEQTNELINYQKEIGALEEEITLLQNQAEQTELVYADHIKISDVLKMNSSELDDLNVKLGTQELVLEDEIKQHHEIINSIKEQVNIGKEKLTNEEDYSTIIGHIKEESSQLNKETRESLELVLSNVTSNEELLAVKEKIYEITNRDLVLSKNKLTSLQTENKILQNTQALNEKIANAKEKQKNYQQQFDQIYEMGQGAAGITQQIVTLTSALGNMAMTWSSVNSLIDTWNNDQASFGDKITQTFMTLGMTIPIVISNFNKLNEVFGFSSSLLDVYNAKKTAKILLDQKENATISAQTALTILFNKTQEEEVLSTAALISEKQLDNIITGKSTIGAVAYNLTKQAGIILSKEQKKALISVIQAKAAEKTATDAQTISQNALNTSMLAFPGTWILLALVAIAGAVAFATKQYEKYIQAQIDANNAIIEESNKIQEETNANKELYDSYETLYSQYKKNEIEKEDLYDVTDQLIEKYEIEGGHLAELTGNYDKLTEAIRKARAAELEETIQATNKEVDAAGKNLLPIGQQTEQGTRLGDTYQVAFDYGFVRQGIDKQAENVLKKYVQGAYSSREGSLVSEVDANDREAIIQQYEQISQAVEEMDKTMSDADRAGSEVYQNAKNYIDSMTETIEEYKTALEELKQYNVLQIAENIGIGQADSLNEFTKKIEELKKALSKEDLGDSSVDEVVEQYLSELDNDYANITLALNELKQQVDDEADQYIDSLTEGQKEYLLSGKVNLEFVQTKEDIEREIQQSFSNLGTFDVESPVSLQTTLASGTKLKKADKTELQELESETYEAMAGFDDKSVLHQLETIDEITQYRIAKNKEFLTDYEDSIQKQIELREQEKNHIFETTEAYEQAQEELKKNANLNREEKEALEEKIQKYEELDWAIHDLNDSLEAGLSWDQVEDIGFGSLIADLESVENIATSVQNAMELIGDSFKVAASDVEKFSNMFPEMLENAKVLSDGSLQLDKDIVQQNIAGVKAEMEARTKAKIAEVDQQIELKKLDKQYLQEKLKNLESYLKGEQNEQATIDAINKAGQEYESELNAILGEENRELTDQAIANSEAEGKALIDMLNAVGSGFAQAAAAHYAMLNGEEYGDWKQLDFSGTAQSAQEYAANSGANATAAYERASETYEEIFKQAQETQAQLNTVSGELDQLNAQRAILESTSQSAINSLDNVSSGKAGKDSESSSSSSKNKELKQLDEEFDRYWEINKALDALDRQLEKIDKDQENLYGKELIRSLKQENELLANQTQLYEQLVAAQQQEAAELRGTLANSGVAFDASGAIINYAQATAAALKEYNDAVIAYNNGLLDDAALEIHEQKFEQFKKDLERYDTLFYTEIQDTMDKIDDLRRQTLANNLKAWEVEIQLKLDFKELERDWNDFIKEVTEDFQSVFKDLRVELKSMLKDATTYTGSEGTINTIISAVHNVTSEIDKLMNGGSSDMFESVSQAQEKLKELNDELLDASKTLHDLWEEAWDNYLDGIDEVADAFDKLMDRFERIDDELEFQGKLIELLYGDEAYKLMSKLYEGQQKNTEVQLQSLKTQVDMWKDLFYSSGATLENQTSWTEDQEKYYEEWMEAQSALNDLVIDYIELLQEDYLNTVSDILAELEESITGSSLDDLNTEWERISANADKYYDSVEGAYYIQSLANKIDQSIADADSLKAQQKLMALREKEISYLREKENLTEYDIEAAELRYQIALKELALEDAQNSKTSMKLTRNEQGNWSYQYVADETDIANKQQELLDAYNDLYQLASDAYENNLEALQELQETYLESAKEIAEDTTLTEEEKQQKLLELREWYLEQYQLLAEENQLYRNDLATSGAALLLEIYEQDQDAYESMTEKERELVDALINANLEDYMELEEALKENYQEIGDKAKEVMSETRLDWTSGAQLIADLWNKDSGWSVKTQVNQAYDSIIEANRKYKEAVDWCAAAVERNFGEEGITGAIQNAEYETDNLKYKTVEMVNESIPYLQELRSYVNQIAAAWQSVQQEIMNTISLINEYLQKVGEANAAAVQSASTGSSASSGGSSGSSSRGSSSSSGSSGGSSRHSWAVYNPTMGSNAALAHFSTESEAAAWVKRNGGSYYQEYATGGYTGSWGDGSGKLAMLHQKELVLNADDTKNFLSGINTIRDLSSGVGGSIQDAVLKAVANTALSLGSIKANEFSGGVSNNSSTTDNVFNITAEFPNANSVDDIREAILSLPNIASQYSNSTLK